MDGSRSVPHSTPSRWFLSSPSDLQETFKACATLATVTDVFAAAVVPAGDEEKRASGHLVKPPDYATRVDD